VPNINLIASRREERLRLESLSRHLLFSIAIAFGLGVVGWSFLAVRTFSLRGELSDISAEIIKLQPAVDKIQYYREQTGELQPRIACLEKARQQTLYWRDLAESLGHSMARDTWLTSIDVEEKTDPKLGRVRDLVLKGVSFTQEQVGATMMHVNRKPYFDDVKLQYTREATVNGEPTLDFEVVCRLPKNPVRPKAGGEKPEGPPAKGVQND
jgi:Tfp pilus assembly protein PilN